MFNLLIQFLPMLVTLPLREGGQMEHAAQNTQTKSHFLSTSQPPCLWLPLPSPASSHSAAFFSLSTAERWLAG